MPSPATTISNKLPAIGGDADQDDDQDEQSHIADNRPAPNSPPAQLIGGGDRPRRSTARPRRPAYEALPCRQRADTRTCGWQPQEDGPPRRLRKDDCRQRVPEQAGGRFSQHIARSSSSGKVAPVLLDDRLGIGPGAITVRVVRLPP